MTVDEFVQAKVLPEFRDLVNHLRRTMLELVPGAQESVSYGIPVFKLKKIFAVISPTKKDITLSFTHGKMFEDKYNKLRGQGKLAAHIKYKRIEDVAPEMLAYYVAQALKLDSQ